MKKIIEKNPSFPGNKPRVWSRKGLNSQKGFTLVEIIVTLVIVGMMAALGGMGIVQAVKGYITVKENSVMTQKAQLAMSRITREIVEMISIPSAASQTVLPIKGSNCVSADCVRKIGLHDEKVKIAFGASTNLADGDVLIDNVSGLTFTYYQDATPSTSWAAGNDINLSIIDIAMAVSDSDGNVLTFTNRVAPRNNGNLGGATLPGNLANIPPSWGIPCFVATAVYGDSGHFMVQILREFRDRYLLPWSGGRWLVKKYYEHGPAAADFIREKPFTMTVARSLLTPFAALAFCLMYAPLAIPFIFAISFVIISAAFSVGRRASVLSGVLRSRGSILLGLIITMVIMALLGAAMLPLMSASYMNQAYADHGRKVYFLAESGFRYAAFEFRNAATESAKDAVLADINNKTYHLLDNAGSFTIKVYPYWFKTTAAAAGATTLVSQTIGYLPQGMSSMTNGYIRVGSSGTGYKYHSYTAASGSGSNLTFTGLSPALSATAAGLSVQPMVLPNSSVTVTNGGNLAISASGSDAFPLLAGTFTMEPTPSGISGGLVYRYEKRAGNVLQNITLADKTKTWADFTVATGSIGSASTTKIVLDKYLQLSSTGTIENASREIIYNVPVGWLTSGEFTKQQYLDKMDNSANWFTGADQIIGSHVLSGGAMAVTTVADPTGINPNTLIGVIRSFLRALRLIPDAGLWGAIGFNWGNTNTNLAKSWMDTQGSLSYDLQVKMNNTEPYFMTGIGFRMRSNANETDAYGYGVSVARQRQTRVCTSVTTLFWTCPAWQNDDGINTTFRPMTSYSSAETIDSGWAITFWRREARYSADPYIMLWQRNGPANATGGFKRLAYRTITAADGLTTGSGTGLRLKPWVTLMVRVLEGYELPFTLGRVDAAGRHLKYGDMIQSSDGTKKARVVGTPIITANWGANNSTVAQGRFILTNVTGGGFVNNEDIYLVGGGNTVYARASGAQAGSKANYIMVYYSDNKTPVAGDAVQANNTRVGNVRYTTETAANWPPDDWTDRAASNDYFTLIGGTTAAIRWTNLDTTADSQGYSASFVPALNTTDLYQAVIKTAALVSPAWNSGSVASDFLNQGDFIALVTSSSAPNQGATTFYDDFAIQLDVKAGTGFLPPIQQ